MVRSGVGKYCFVLWCKSIALSLNLVEILGYFIDFVFNLGGYSTLQCVDANVYNISGWSDHIFTYIEAINKPSEILDTIRNYV